MVRIPVARFALPAVLALAVNGCSAGSGANPDAGTFVNCDTEPRAMPYQAGMQVLSEATPPVFTVKLLQSVPGPPVKGENTWTIEVDETATGMPLDGLVIAVTPWMPDHGHGTSRDVVVTPTGSGGYTLMPVFLKMPGFWEIRMNIVGTMVGAGTTDNAIVPICVP